MPCATGIEYVSDNDYEQLDRMRAVGRYLGIDRLTWVHLTWPDIFDTLEKLPEHESRFALGLFYEGEPCHEEPELRKAYPNGTRIAQAMETVMRINWASGRASRRPEEMAANLKAHIEELASIGLLDMLFFEYAGALHGMRRVYKALDTEPFDLFREVERQAKGALRKPHSSIRHGIDTAVRNAYFYPAIEAVSDIYFGLDYVWQPHKDGNGEERILVPIRQLRAQHGSRNNPLQGLINIYAEGFVPHVFLEGGRVKAWIYGENIVEKIDTGLTLEPQEYVHRSAGWTPLNP